MSNAVASNLRTVSVVTPNMQFHNSGTYAVPLGNMLYTPTVIPTTAFDANGGTVTFQAQPPSNTVAMDRSIFVKWSIQVDITAIAGASGNAFDPGVFDAPRFAPMSQCVSTVSCNLNNSTVSLNTNFAINAFSRCNMDNNDTSFCLSLMPSRLDQFQNYSDAQNFAIPNGAPGTNTNGAPGSLTGVVADPLQSFGQVDGNYTGNRGAWSLTNLTNGNGLPGTTQNASFQFTTMEPLWLSPFGASTEDNYSLVGLTSFTVQFTLNNLTRVWSHSDHPNASIINPTTGIRVTILANPELHVTWLTPSQAITIPDTVLYPFSAVVPYQTSTITAAPGVIWTQATQNIQLDTIPTRMIIFCERQQSTKTITTTDTFALLKNISITFDNQSGILAQASQEDLYLESLKNGLQMTYLQYTRTVGSIFILDTCKNLCLTKMEEAPGQNENKQFQITTTWQNINQTQTIPFTVWILVINAGLITVSNGQIVQQTGVLTKADVLNSISDPNKQVMQPSASFFGGRVNDYGSGINSFFKKANKFVSGVGSTGRNVQGQMASFQPATGGYRPHRSFGRALIGGAMIDKETLRKRAYEEMVDDDDEEY